MEKEKTTEIATVWGSAEEREAIQQMARSAKVSVSAYVRRLLGFEPLLRGTPKRKEEIK